MDWSTYGSPQLWSTNHLWLIRPTVLLAKTYLDTCGLQWTDFELVRPGRCKAKGQQVQYHVENHDGQWITLLMVYGLFIKLTKSQIHGWACTADDRRKNVRGCIATSDDWSGQGCWCRHDMVTSLIDVSDNVPNERVTSDDNLSACSSSSSSISASAVRGVATTASERAAVRRAWRVERTDVRRPQTPPAMTNSAQQSQLSRVNYRSPRTAHAPNVKTKTRLSRPCANRCRCPSRLQRGWSYMDFTVCSSVTPPLGVVPALWCILISNRLVSFIPILDCEQARRPIVESSTANGETHKAADAYVHGNRNAKQVTCTYKCKRIKPHQNNIIEVR